MSHIVVVGAGQAGASMVIKLRSLGFGGEITLIGDENVPPYQRPPLSKRYLLDEMEVERLFLRPKAYYRGQDIALKLGRGVAGIDVGAKTVHLGDEVLVYDQLALATGSEARRLPASIGGSLEGVYGIRRLVDIDRMAAEFQMGRRLLIVGGGYIGLEAAAVAAKRGLKVTLVEMADRILQRVASTETSDYFRALHQSHGVEILEGIGLRALRGEERVSGAILSDGRVLSTDFVIAGVGIVPSTDLAETAGLDIENGIKTDAHGRTSNACVWAAGDCTSFPYQERRIRLESVPNAIDQAEIVAENMLGANKKYIAKPWFWSDQFDVKLQIAGLNSGYDKIITRKGKDSVSFWYYCGEKLLAVDAMNDPRAYMVAKRLIDAGKTADVQVVKNSGSDLKSLLKS
ncbi:MAG: FAD-dependent oxidoreductase [Alphaproteobacteria bacterium]|nr:FAD-dependent oxidoreductase [Alphaproteobacteria bacterium]